MKFKDSFFYFSVVRSIRSWRQMSPYYIALGLPLMITVVVISIIATIPIDGYVACREVWRVME